jgi:O-antigen/teichoic acid export membrane protein
MLAGLAGNMLMTGLTWWYANRFHPVRFAWDIDYIKHIIKISLPYGIALFLNVIFFKVDVILLSVMEKRDIADTAIALYSLPMKIVEVGMMYGTIFLNSLLPVLTHAIEKKDDEKTASLMKHAFTLLFAFGAGISLFLTIFAKDIIRLISTEEYVHTTLLG